MCQAINEMIEDGRREGKREGTINMLFIALKNCTPKDSSDSRKVLSYVLVFRTAPS